ncbi:MAG: hypothetical protein ACREHD_05150 [Pirellulales bacterium]
MVPLLRSEGIVVAPLVAAVVAFFGVRTLIEVWQLRGLDVLTFVPGMVMNQIRHLGRWGFASLACSFIAFISHIAAMRMAASVVMAIAQRQRLADQAQRLSYNSAFDSVAWTAGALALVLALIVARGETPRMRTFIFAAAVVANLWNLCVV